MSSNKDIKSEADSREVIKMMLPPTGAVEVRGKQNGTWTVAYPDPGFIPCSPVCDLQKVSRSHKHDYTQDMIETNYKPTSYEDAVAWAEYLSDGREIKVVPFMTASERATARAAAKRAAEGA